MTFLLTSDFRSLEKEIDRLSHLPGPSVIAELELGLAMAFSAVTSHVHVITGALKGSGKTASETHQDGVWEGQMTWGGPSPGFLPKPAPAHPRHENHPAEDQRARDEVVYAFYEKRRGQEHDYLRDQDIYTQLFKQIFDEAVKGK